VDGLCATACPVDINTGDLIKRLRRESHSLVANKRALFAAKNFRTIEWCARAALKLGRGINTIFGQQAMPKLTRGIKKLIPALPLWSSQIQYPPGLDILDENNHEVPLVVKGSIVYFPACISRVLGSYKGKEKNLMETFLSICRKNGIDAIVLKEVNGSCCGQVFSSKGYMDAYQFTANNIVERLWYSSREGELPIVIDVSSCAYTLHHLRPALHENNKNKFDRLKILDSVDFLHDMILPLVTASKKKGSIVLHPVCSLEKMKTENKLVTIAKHFAEEVTVPASAGCCGMAGDRGFLFPEMTASATKPEATEVNKQQYSGYYSSTKTCEIALSESVKENYESILYLVDEAI